MDKIIISDKLALIHEAWRPKVVAELNGQEVKLAKLHGSFVWHRHDDAEELFFCIRGRFHVELRDRVVDLGPGEMVVVPRGVEHRTVADEEAEVLLLSPISMRNTGNVEDERFTAPSGVHI